jgi:hypothetical protein
MNRLAMLTVVVAAFGMPHAASAQIPAAQQKVVHFKKLQEFLPAKDVAGFKRGKPSGQTSTAMGMATSEASVRYLKDGKESQSIEVKIADVSGIPFGAMAMSAVTLGQADFENETEQGHEKSVTIAGYKGTEEVRRGSTSSCKLGLVVGGRFMVEVNGIGFSDPAALRALAEGMNLGGLEKVAP